ncbi:kunitz-type serine protease inhibitor bitisilin-2-like [Daktulosphaira vitifoliae]|uniref:kunitz-type serine protease inhibitor bitisilin-2-like n=1 Tax=Daktulosphaira vitifoliae TaxID=58002 RepID=UPI0021AA3662|nr:kunitz-type serine protease inhibitor bitisilin-2-like [Daktulosphaira vitifoliae]
MFPKISFVVFLSTVLCLTSFINAVPVETIRESRVEDIPDWTEPPPHPFTKSDCLLPPQIGGQIRVCMAYFIKYHFDDATKTCKTFVYGGCLGNNNRFETEKECLDACL